MKIILTCINIILLFLSINIFAQQIIVELQVNNESEDERKQAFAQALDQVLTKNGATIKATPPNPSMYVQSYTYVTHAANQQAMFLQIQFDQAAIKQLLQQATKPKQQAGRQQVLVWLVKVTASGNKIMEDESSNDVIVPIFKKNAQDYGASIMFPMSDLQDTSSIKADDICNLNPEAIKGASQRYGARSIIAGCMKEPTADSIWTSQWLLLRDGKSNTFNFSGATADSVIMQAIGATSVKQSLSNQQKKIILRVTNVKGLDQYSEVVHYLTTFSQIAQVDLIKISPTDVELSVNARGDKQALAAIFDAQKSKLVHSTDTAPLGIDLDYKWVTVGNEQPQAIGTKSVP
ncbi:MAG: DUF2066 domain-containing protein [bacterium]